MSILIKNARIFMPGGAFRTDIFVSDGKIKEIGKNLSQKANANIDATGFYVFPGGVDPHVHMQLPTPAGPSSDTFESGSLAALFGGTTSIIDFVTPRKGQSIVEALHQRIAEASPSLVDYTFHISPIGWNDNTESEIIECVRQGFPSFKVYMAYKQSVGIDEEVLFKVMKAVGKAGGIVVVHCEIGDEIDRLRDSFVIEGKISPLYHPLSRPASTEYEAIKIAIATAEKTHCPLYIVHVSSGESLQYIRHAQANGQTVYAETCPHYLLLNDQKYVGEFDQTAPYVMSPPLRKPTDSAKLWQGLSDRTFQTIGTDHCPFSLAQKAAGRNDFRLIPNGIGGVEQRLELIYSFGVGNKHITIERFVELTSAEPARIFNLLGKGRIEVGADADLIIWNPEKEKIISAKTHHSLCDNNVYEGMKTKGAVQTVIKNGEIVIENDRLMQRIPGKLLLRKR